MQISDDFHNIFIRFLCIYIIIIVFFEQIATREGYMFQKKIDYKHQRLSRTLKICDSLSLFFRIRKR